MDAVATYDTRPTNESLRHLQGDYGLPFLGKTLGMFRDPVRVFGDHYQKFGPVSRFSTVGTKCVLLMDPDHAQRVLLDRDKDFSAKMGWAQTMGEFFQGGLVMRDFADHRLHRGIMQTAFKPDAMRVYVDKIAAIVATSCERWAAQGQIEFYTEMKLLLLDIACEVFCWDDDADRTKIHRAFVDMMEGSLGVVRKDWPGLLYHRGMQGRRYLYNYFLSLIANKRASDDQDIFAHFCREKTEEGAYFSDDDIANHMVFLMLAAHDTTTSAATMAAYYLANDRGLQDSLAAEVRAVGEITYDALFRSVNSMANLLYETIRLHPPVPLLLRRTVRATKFDGLRVPADTMVMIAPIYLHRLPQWWSEPDAFKPSRFSEEVSEQRKHNFMWIPFGGGAHKCIGMHFARLLFVSTFAQILSTHRIEYARDNYFPAKVQHFPFAKLQDNLPVRLVPV